MSFQEVVLRTLVIGLVFFFYSLGIGWSGRTEVAEENRTNARCVSV